MNQTPIDHAGFDLLGRSRVSDPLTTFREMS
jgi:hypothetical protein